MRELHGGEGGGGEGGSKKEETLGIVVTGSGGIGLA